jgi:hypothetical protein
VSDLSVLVAVEGCRPVDRLYGKTLYVQSQNALSSGLYEASVKISESLTVCNLIGLPAHDEFLINYGSSLGPCNWTNVIGNLATNGVNVFPLASSQNLSLWKETAFSPDQYSQITITAYGDDTPAAVVRISPTGDASYAMVGVPVAGTITLYQTVATVGTAIQTVSGLTLVDGDIYQLRVIGSVLRMFLNGVQIGTDQIDTAVTTGQPGIFINDRGSPSLLNNFVADQLSVPVGSHPTGWLHPGIMASLFKPDVLQVVDMNVIVQDAPQAVEVLKISDVVTASLGYLAVSIPFDRVRVLDSVTALLNPLFLLVQPETVKVSETAQSFTSHLPASVARSSVCFSGTTYAGWTPPQGTITINGVVVSVLYNDFTLDTKADGTPATLTFSIISTTPLLGQEVILYYARPNDILFQGRILQMSVVTPDKNTTVYQCTAVGDQWLMDRYDRVNANYLSTGIETIAADILARSTDGNFRVGYVSPSLGNITMGFTNETVSGAMSRIAKAGVAFWEVVPLDGVSRIVNIYQTYPEQAPATVTDSMIIAQDFTYKTDLTQVRTRVLFEGIGSTATFLVPAGSTTIAIDDISPYSASGGTVSIGFVIATYTGVTATSGPGFLTGVTGLTADVAQGDSVNIVVVTVDAGDTAALAARLGGGLSGQATNSLQDQRLSNAEAAGRGATDIATFGLPLEDAQWTYNYTATQRWLRVGRSVPLNIVHPPVSGSFLAQEIQITPIWPINGNFQGFKQTVSGSKYVRTMTDLLSKIAGS